MPTTEEVPSEPKVQPDINAIIAMLNTGGEIENAEKAQQEGMSTLGKLYQRIEKNMRGNRGAVAAIRKMQKMSADKRADYIRTLEPLLVHYKYTLDDIDPDLADLAAKASAAKEQTGGDDDEEDGEKPSEEGDPGTPAPISNEAQGILEEAKLRLAGGTAGSEPTAKGKAKLSIASPGNGTQH